MPRRAIAVLVAVLVAVLASVALAGVATAAAAPDPPDTAVDNQFIPEDRDLTECISAVPRPGCGSEARGGWRQLLVLAAIAAGLAFITWRVVRATRRGRTVTRTETR